MFRLMLGGLVTYSSRTASVMFDGRRPRLVAVVDRSHAAAVCPYLRSRDFAVAGS